MSGRTGRWLLFIASLGFAALGQIYFAKRPDFFADGVLFYAIAVVLFVVLVSRPTRPSPPTSRAPTQWTHQRVIRLLLGLTGLFLGALAAVQAVQPQKNYWPILWVWLVGILCYLLAFVNVPRRGSRVRRRPSATVAESSAGASQIETRTDDPTPAVPIGQEHSSEITEDKPDSPHSGIRLDLVIGDGAPRGRGNLSASSMLFKERAQRWVASHGWEIGLLLVLIAGAFWLRAWRIDSIPWTLGGDEGSQGMWARDVIGGRLPNMFGLGWLAVPNLSFYWQALWLLLAGDNIVGLRLPWALVGALTVLGTYLLVRRLFDRRLALLTGFLLATYHFHIHYSRLGSNQVADPLFVVWALYLMVVGWQAGGDATARARGRGRWAWAASGIIAGLAFYFYAGSRQVPVVLLAVIATAALTEKDFLRERANDLLVMLGGFFVAAGPMVLYALQHPNDFNARLNQVGIFQSHWVEAAEQATGRGRSSLLVEQFRKAFFAFNFYKDRVAWYGPSIPLLDFFASIFFVFGGAISVSRLRQAQDVPASGPVKPVWRYAVFVVWFVLVVVLGGALTENPPSSQRLVGSAVPAMFFVAVALRELSLVLRELWDLPELGRRVLVGVVAVALALISLRYYFGPYQDSWTYGSFNAEVATRIGYYLRDLGPEWKEYFFGAPRMYADFGSTPFIAKGITLFDAREPLIGAPYFVDPNHKAVFIFLPERIGELDLVRQAFPNGVTEEIQRIGHPDGPLLFTAYRVGG